MNVKQVDLYYPGTGTEPDVVDAIQIELMHVRAARDIRVTYDFERDGWVVSAHVDPELEGEWVEKSFIPAWENAAQASCDSNTEARQTGVECTCAWVNRLGQPPGRALDPDCPVHGARATSAK